MELQLRKNILFDILPSGNKSNAVMIYGKDIEQTHLKFKQKAIRLGISRDVIEFTEAFR